jgi:hypothetical protein
VPQEAAEEPKSMTVRIAGLAVSALVLLVMIQPVTLSSVHGLLEYLTH